MTFAHQLDAPQAKGLREGVVKQVGPSACIVSAQGLPEDLPSGGISFKLPYFTLEQRIKCVFISQTAFCDVEK